MREIKAVTKSRSNKADPVASKAAETAASKSAKRSATAVVKKPAVSSKIKTAVTPDQRSQMIAEAAYLRAENRGFVGGDSVHDWIEAEAEIDNLIIKTR